jgi:hypothetical protein
MIAAASVTTAGELECLRPRVTRLVEVHRERAERQPRTS